MQHTISDAVFRRLNTHIQEGRLCCLQYLQLAYLGSRTFKKANNTEAIVQKLRAGECLQIKHYTTGEAKDQGLVEGDVLVTNHPQLAGGSHLPDITVITPVFIEGQIVFFVASRGHHADVGGITPGSMPPHSHRLEEEGAAILSFKVVKDGVFQASL